MSIFILVIYSASNILIYTSHTSSRIHVTYELEQNARIAMEFLTSHIRGAQAIELKTDIDNTLDTLWLYTNVGTSDEHITTFKYDLDTERNWLMFGGRQPGNIVGGTQELSRYISDIKIIIDESRKLLHITITTDTTIENTTVELNTPIVLNQTLDIRYKQIK